MKGKSLSVFVVIVLLLFILSGCQRNNETTQVTRQDTQPQQSVSQSPQKETEKETEKLVSAPAFQFVEGHGIVKSESPIYMMDTDTAPEITKGNVTISLVDVVQQDRRLIASFAVTDPTDIERIEDVVDLSLEIRMTGPGIPEEGLPSEESKNISNPEFYEEYGYTRSFFMAVFELPITVNMAKNLTGYEFRFLNFEQAFEFTMKQAPSYETLDALAASEGSMDTHDGFSVLAVGELVDEGILVNWYRYSEDKDRIASISFTPPTTQGKGTWPVLYCGEKEFEFKRSSRYIDSIGFLYQLTDRFSGVGKQLFIVPQGERDGVFSLKIPGITYLSSEESAPITIQIPEDTKELTEEIPFREGNVRIHRITKMQELQIKERTDRQGNTIAIERPAVYIDVSAVSATKELSLRRLICKSKSGTGYSSWENQRYDFDDDGNLSGFRIFYNEGDREISLKFNLPGFYWEQPYEIMLQPRGEMLTK